MESILLDIMFDLPGLEEVKEVVISRRVVEGTTLPLYIYAAIVPGAPARAPESTAANIIQGIWAGRRICEYHRCHRPPCSLPGPSAGRIERARTKERTCRQ
jgi:hypothetical protein